MKLLNRLRLYFPTIFLIGVFFAATIIVIFRRTDDVHVLRWAHVYETSSPYHAEALWAAEQVYARTNGRYRIRVYPASSLGNEVSINEALELGSVDLIYTGASLAAQYYGPLSLSDYPYTIRDLEHWKAYKRSDLFTELSDGYSSATGNEIMSLVYYGFRHVISNKAIHTPADMKNLKIRVPQAQPFMMMPQQTGANPTPMPFQEVYLGLQQGVIEAAENPLTTIYYKRFYEVQSHISLTGHIANSLVIVGSGDMLDSLSAEDREIVSTTITQASDRAIATIIKQETEFLEWYRENGIIVTEPERAAFAKAVRPALSNPGMPFTAQQLERLEALAVDSKT